MLFLLIFLGFIQIFIIKLLNFKKIYLFIFMFSIISIKQFFLFIKIFI